MNDSKTAAAAGAVKPEFEIEIDDFLSMSDVQVELTYLFAPETIVFPCELMLNQAAIEMRQKFYKGTEAEQAAGSHAYHVDFICSVLTGRPRGLPRFADFCEANFSSDKTQSPEFWKKALKAYLMRGGNVAIKIAEDAVDRYSRMTAPTEFFR